MALVVSKEPDLTDITTSNNNYNNSCKQRSSASDLVFEQIMGYLGYSLNNVCVCCEDSWHCGVCSGTVLGSYPITE